jgi:2-polyprenyl-6-methoxyphenol hydroxylase-like FAD-dependent oxidoreductase
MKAGHAVVVGGSISGLCAGRVLSDFFDRVTVVDRDAYPSGVEDRPGVSQGRHVHALLARGLAELDRLFPGFEKRLLDGGAVDIDFGLDFAALRLFGWAPRVPIGLRLLFASRALIETTIRRLFSTLPNVELVERTTVTGLVVADGESRHVTGVHISSPDAGRGSELAADLVVDASGRGSKAPEWLRAIGLEPPAETTVDSLAGYSTRWFAAPDPSRWPKHWWWKGIWIDPKIPDELQAGVLFPVEGRRWIVTLGGLGGQYPPTDEEGFTRTLATLRSPILAEAVSLATPISPIYGNRAMANRLRHYESWKARLPRFLAVADSVCAFNPVYGQGMTTAAICAGVLEECLGKYGPSHPELASRFFRAQARAESGAWEIATGADFMIRQTVGVRPLASRFSVPYFQSLFETAMDDMVLLRRFIEVVNMMRPPSSLFTPAMIARVAGGALRRRFAGANAGRAISAMPPAPTTPF